MSVPVIDFEPIYTAFWNFVSAMPGIVTASRRVRHWSDVTPDEQPALFMGEDAEHHDQKRGAPPKNSLAVRLYLYVNVGNDPDAVPAPILNGYLLALRTMLAPETVSLAQTLGGLVSHAWITHVEKDAGILGPQGVALIDVDIFLA